MQTFKRSILTTTAAAGLALAGTAAMAAEATVSLNVRSGPGTSNPVVDTLYAGERVNVGQCTAYNWCYITHSGPDGWVSARYLTETTSPRRAPSRGARNDGFGFSVETPDFSFSIGDPANDRDRRGRRGPRRDRAEVCFYEDFNYGGRSICANPGEQQARLRGAWNDRISSIRIRGNATARICEDWNYNGRCRVVSRSTASLSPRANDVISSYRVN